MTVLIVDDNPGIRRLYAEFLGDHYDVREASSGKVALEQMDDSVTVVVLDRRMPGMTGDEVLAQIRQRGYDCRVVMITGVNPDFDIIGMELDEYVTKPVTMDELPDIVESLSKRAEYSTTVQEYFATASKVATLEAEKPNAELNANKEYLALLDHLAEIKQEAKTTMDKTLDSGLSELFNDIHYGSGSDEFTPSRPPGRDNGEPGSD